MKSERQKDLWGHIRKGLVSDPGAKHYQKIGIALWLYVYLIVNADWGKGCILRTYQKISEDTGIQERALKRWMKKLKDEKYVEIVRKPNSMIIQITKWRSLKNKIGSDKNGTSQDERSDNSGIEKGQIWSSEVTDLVRGDKNVTSLNNSNIKAKDERSDENGTSIRVFNESLYQINNKKRKDLPKPDFAKFLDFARVSHAKIRSTSLSETKKDLEKFKFLQDKAPLPVLCIAWTLFLRSQDRYLRDKPRSVPVFWGQFNNLIQEALNVFQSSQTKFQKRTPKQNQPPLPEGQLEKWHQSLDKIEEQILPDNFELLFRPLAFGGLEENTAKVICQDRRHKITLVKNYGDFIGLNLSQTFGQKIRPEFIAIGDQ